MELQNVSQIFQNPERTISGAANTVQADDYILLCDTSTGVVNVELLEIPNNFDREYKLYIIDISGNAATNNITINAPAGHLINGDASVVINKDNGSAILRFLKLNAYSAFGALNGTTATTDTTIYDRDGTLTGERRLTFGGFNLGFIGTDKFGVGVEPDAIGVSTEANGIDDTSVQYHVAGAIRTDNWYHGRYGLLLHQKITNPQSNTYFGTTLFAGLDSGVASGGGTFLGTTAYGCRTLASASFNSIGNTAIGYEAFRDLTTGQFNTALGYTAGQLTTEGSRNTFIGRGAGQRNVDNDDQTLIGYNTGSWPSEDLVAIGSITAAYCSTPQSVVLGNGSLRGNSSLSNTYDSVSLNNVAIGNSIRTGSSADSTYKNSSCVYIGSGIANTMQTGEIKEVVAVGSGALNNCTSVDAASDSVYIGQESGSAITSTTSSVGRNTMVGWYSGWSLAQSTRNTLIGEGCGFEALNSPRDYDWTNIVAIGSIGDSSPGTAKSWSINIDAINVQASGEIRMGNNNHMNAYIPIGWTITSDIRYKNVSADPVPGLDFVKQLNPIKYKLKKTEYDEVNKVVNIIEEDAETTSRYGFSAQDILALEGTDKVIGDDSDANQLKLRESMIIPTLVNAIKELEQQIVDLKANNNLT